MPTYAAKMESYHYEFDVEKCDAILVIEPNYICVKYDDYDDSGREISVQYIGKEYGEGHFRLSCPEWNGQATLHCFPGGNIYEGYWKEGSHRGMWRIDGLKEINV